MIPKLNINEVVCNLSLDKILNIADIQIEAIYTKEVVKTNETGSKINLPKAYEGRKVFILIPKDPNVLMVKDESTKKRN